MIYLASVIGLLVGVVVRLCYLGIVKKTLFGWNPSHCQFICKSAVHYWNNGVRCYNQSEKVS